MQIVFQALHITLLREDANPLVKVAFNYSDLLIRIIRTSLVALDLDPIVASSSTVVLYIQLPYHRQVELYCYRSVYFFHNIMDLRTIVLSLANRYLPSLSPLLALFPVPCYHLFLE